MTRWFVALFFSLLITLSAYAQKPPVIPKPSPDAASVKFSFDWNQGVPWQAYSFDVQSDGKTRFNGTPHPDATSEPDPVQQDFVMSEANRQKIFELAQKLDYFQHDLDSHLKHIAQTGTKTLRYQSPQVRGSATYNWSQNPDVEELTRLFAAISMTIDYGRKLTFQYRFDKLGMDQRLKELEELQADHGAEELSLIAPILRKIANDPNLMNISRQSAQRLLEAIAHPALAAQTPGQQ
jgi:hypothetical protein